VLVPDGSLALTLGSCEDSTPKTLDRAPQISEASLKPTAILRVAHVMIAMMIAALFT
jgi:hypothetical protein